MATMNLTAKNFPETVKNGIVILDWWAEWCGPCKAFAPIFEASAAAHPDIVFGKVNTDEEQELSSAFGIRSIPTLMLFRDGVLLFAQPGMLDAQSIAELLDRARSLDMDDVRRQIAEAEKAESSENGKAENPENGKAESFEDEDDEGAEVEKAKSSEDSKKS